MGDSTANDKHATNAPTGSASHAPSTAGPPATAADKPVAPATKKAAAKKLDELTEPRKLRRRFVWSCIWGYLSVNFLMFLRFFFPRTLFEPKTVFSIGYAQDFALGVETKFQKDYRIWVVRNAERLFVIFARCTHLGCTPDWKPAENKFKCPCHGSGYDSEGVNFEGPAPRPMDRAKVELSPTGEIVVDTSKLFQCPKTGRCEFNDLDAFLNV